MTSNTEVKPNKNSHIVTVVHQLSHRTRLRFKKSNHTAQHLSRAQELLKETPGLQNIEVNPYTGSMLLLHDDKSGRAIKSAVDKVAEALELLEPDAVLEDGGLIQVSNSLYGLVHQIDGTLSKWSDNTIDLKALLPLALAYIGLRKMSETRSLLGDISPVVLLYYAFDSYYKLNRKTSRKRHRKLRNKDQDVIVLKQSHVPVGG